MKKFGAVMKRYGTLFFLMMLFSIVCLTSCDVLQKNKLTRDKAKEIIIKDCFSGGNIAATGQFITGSHILIWDDDLGFMKKLVTLGFLTLQNIPGSEQNRFFNLNLTDTAKKYVLGTFTDTDPSEKKLINIVRLGDLTLNEVTGIKLVQENKVAIVDFNYKFSNLTPFGENWFEGPTIGNLMKNSMFAITKFLKITADKEIEAEFDYKKRAPNLQQAMVKMELFDDGWRVAKRTKDNPFGHTSEVGMSGSGYAQQPMEDTNKKAEQPPVQKPEAQPMPQPQVAPKTAEEVGKILEKIRSAHLNKDINKWLSCYNHSFPNLGRVENQILELWKNYDVKEVNYRVYNIQLLSDTKAATDIVWNIEIIDKRNHVYTLVRQKYQTTLEKGPDGWKIRDAKEVAGG